MHGIVKGNPQRNFNNPLLSTGRSARHNLLLATKIGTLTVKEPARVPAAVTTINKEQIAMTPARNIYDLLEVYVPGMISNIPYESVGTVGIRGIIEVCISNRELFTPW